VHTNRQLLPDPTVERAQWNGSGERTTQKGATEVQDQFDVSLEDRDLLGEVELTTNLIIAASEADDHLSPDEIDRILGIAH